MADYNAPPGPPPPQVPEGWVARWNEQYKEWFYVNTYTKQSQWEKPTEPAIPPRDDAGAPAGPPPSYFPSNNQPAPTDTKANPYDTTPGQTHTPGGGAAASYHQNTEDEDARLARQLQAEEDARAHAGHNNPHSQSQGSSPFANQLPPRPGSGSGIMSGGGGGDKARSGLFGKILSAASGKKSSSSSGGHGGFGGSHGGSHGGGGLQGALGGLMGSHGSHGHGQPQYGGGGYPAAPGYGGYGSPVPHGHQQGGYYPPHQQGGYYPQQQHGYGGGGGYYPQQHGYGGHGAYRKPGGGGMGMAGGAALGVGAGVLGGVLVADAIGDAQEDAYQEGFEDGGGGDFDGGDFGGDF